MTQSLDPLNEQEHEDLKMISPPRRQREKFVSLLLSRPPIRKRGEEELYSNAGFSVAGAMAEKVTGEEYEALLARTIFKPLAMTTAGFGAMGTPDKVDAPWQHELKNGKPVPVNPGPFSDNPPYLAPGGRVHCSIGDWAKYVQSVLRALRNEKGLLSRADVGQLLSPPYSGEYALGWKICERDWAGGRAYTHGGSNGRNFCIVWISPTRNFAVLVATNCGGDRVFNDLDGLCGQLISKFLQ